MDALAAAAFNVMLTVVLVPSMGMLGAAYSLIPSFALYAGLVWMQSRAVVPWAIDWRHLAGSVFGAVVAIAMATMINAHMPPMNLVRLAAGTAVFGAVYGLCQVALAGGVPKLTLRNKGEPHIG
jgi:peptidoglycan biosynthesis protein MviN/MurJ (putative lipid II flippase)